MQINLKFKKNLFFISTQFSPPLTRILIHFNSILSHFTFVALGSFHFFFFRRSLKSSSLIDKNETEKKTWMNFQFN